MPIPTFHLYGEPRTGSAAELVHVETLDERSRPGNWTIQPHLHADLHHVILIEQGGGAMEAEGLRTRFRAPCLLFVPAGTLHGFRWHAESRGAVMTVGDAHLAALAARDTEIAALFAHARAVELSGELPQDCEAVAGRFHRIAALLDDPLPGSRATVEALLLLTLAEGIGRTSPQTAAAASPRQVQLVQRLRQRIEARFHLREPVSAYAAALGASETSLRLACQQVAGLAPAAMLDRRALLEAQRLLRNSRLPIADVAKAAGFGDPAYFTRFFRRHTGLTPRDFRQIRPG